MTAKEFNENELLFNELYEKTKDCGRVQFINLLMAKEIENRNLNELFNAAKQVAEGHLKNEIELKKQLKECYCNRTDCSGRIKDSKQYDSLVQKVEAQQKEFIEWLEANLEALEMCDREFLLTNNKKEIKVYKEILSKYKEIIGVKDE